MKSLSLLEKLNSIKDTVSNGDLEIAVSEFKLVLDDLKELEPERRKKISDMFVAMSARVKQLLSNKESGVSDTDEYFKNFSKSISSFLFLLNEVEGYAQKNKFQSQLPTEGLIKIKPKEATLLAIDEINKAQSMKVIGMGRQNFAEIGENNHILEYYKAIEEKLRTETETRRPFSVKRVTQHILKDKFKTHLRKCFEIIQQPKNNNKYEIVLYGDLRITYTYYIIKSIEAKKATLFLTLNVEDFADIFDTCLVFYSRDNDIINEFEKHFDQFWNSEGKKGRVIANLRDFEKYIPFDQELYNNYNEIKNFIKRVPNDSVRMRHLQKEISLFHKRLKGLDDCLIEYRHTEKNQRVSDCFIDYISDLKDGSKSYQTISVRDFWETLYDSQMFLSKQETSLYKGAKIERIYLVDSSKLGEGEENKAEQIALLRNYMQHLQYPNYCFTILFSTDEYEIRRRENFAIWSDNDINYKVLFSIKYGLNSPGVTELSFANFTYADSSKMHNNQEKIKLYQNNFDFAKKRVREQNNKLLIYLSDKKSTNLIMESEYAAIENQLNFLKRNGITDLEKFLAPK